MTQRKAKERIEVTSEGFKKFFSNLDITIGEGNKYLESIKTEQLIDIREAFENANEWISMTMRDDFVLSSIKSVLDIRAMQEEELASSIRRQDARIESSIKQEVKHFPQPEYCKCNAGHTLVEVFNEKKNRYDWDCPICINKMQKARGDSQ